MSFTESDYVRNAPEPTTEVALEAEVLEVVESTLPATTPAIIEIEEEVKRVRTLSFTVVHGWLKGEHRCPFELHATGCRDLNKLKKTGQFSYEVLAPTREDAMVQASQEHGFGMVWTQPCCLLKRMQAIGRA